MEGQIAACPQCGHSNPSGAIRCERCSTPFVSGDATMPGTIGVAPGWSMAGPAGPANVGSLAPGSVLGNRYEILEQLGEGGMGAVYKARDRELDRLVALKVIRPELAGHPQMLQRFKQELILARQVTHRNVIRIYDLGVADGVKFITMEFLEGRDLSALMRERKLTPQEGLRIMQQVCRALEAAHAEGVVHRDLKPQNIMVDERGKVSVMDFGLARSTEMSFMTQTGAMLGTPAYMSPEQAKGQPADGRSDIFAFGIIFYELLSGKLPFEAESVLASLLKRTQERAPSVHDIDASVSKPISMVVDRCLAINPAERYQSASEVLEDLNALEDPGARAATAARAAPDRRMRLWRWAAVGLGSLLLILGAIVLFRSFFGTAPPAPKNVTLVVADFENATGDPAFDGSLEPMFGLALEGAPFINLIRRDQALRTAARLRPGSTKLDQTLARLVAQSEGISVILAGSIDRQGSGYRVSVRAVDGVTGQAIATRETQVGGKEEVLAVVGKLAAPIRKALGDTTPESVQLAAAETFTAASLEAAQSYAAAQRLRFEGKSEDAIQRYLRAIELDPNFGSAYAGLAAMYANRGQREEATKYYQAAMARIGRMTVRERYRTRGGYYLVTLDHQKAIEEFSALAKEHPADATGLSNLAFAYYLQRDMGRALEVGRRALAINSKNVPYRNNVALYALYAGEFETAAREARAVLEANPSYLKGYVTLALSELALGRPAATAESYRRLETVSALGTSFAATGLADLALYEGRAADAAAILEKAIAADLTGRNTTAAAKKSAMLGVAQLALERKAPALAAAGQALGWSREASVVFPAARVYLEAGQAAKAAALASELGAKLEPAPRAYAQLIEGEIELKRGRAREAIRLFEQAQKLADTWLVRFDLGRAYLEAQAFPQADSEFEACLKRRGEATDIFLDEIQTYSYLPPVHYYRGRAREGLGSPSAAESYRAFLSIREKGDADALLADARRRLSRP